MDSTPSFSLGLTKIQSTSNEIDMPGFVPDNFDYKNVGFCENRSKYRNDPTIMTKLRVTASVKGKKTASDKGKKTVVAISMEKKGSCEKRPITKGDEICDQNGSTSFFERMIDMNNIRGKDFFQQVNELIETGLFVEKQLYRLGGMPHVLNVWMYECCSKIDKDIACRIGNGIPRIFNCLNKDVEKNEARGDDLGTPKEHPKDFPEKESETEVKNDAFQHSIDNIIADFSSPVSAIQSEELLQKENLPDLILRKNNIEVQNKLQVSCTVVSFEAFQELIDNIIAGMSTPIIAMAANSGDISQKANLPDPPLHTTNVKVPNELRESTNAISTDSSQESIDNIIAKIFTPVVAMKMKSVSPTEINNNECQIHDTQFQLVLSEEEEVGKQDVIKTRAPKNRKRTTIFRSPFTTEFGSSCKGKESATVDFPQKHPFDGYLIFHEMLMRLIEEYSDWIVEGLLKFHEKKDCGVFMVAYTEFLSDPMQISSSNLVAEYLRKRYATLL
ncbi:hypothetical protein FXO37_35764 [Capsicum annuum]|nr:hypothetical protein FXO37_35764 [Capsicum annuum]